MRTVHRLLGVVSVAWLAAASTVRAGQDVRVTALLDLYLSGEHDAVVTAFENLSTFVDLLDQLQRDAKWPMNTEAQASPRLNGAEAVAG